MRRVLVIGSGGFGKSTFSNRLGKLLNIEVLHLDTFFWHPGWIETPKSEWQKKVEELLSRDAWIIESSFGLFLRGLQTYLCMSDERCNS